MATVGSTLSAERIRQGLDLQDIAGIIKLSPRSIQAIESDDFEQLPGLVFARNFVRQYAEALRVDPVAITRQFDREQSFSTSEFVLPERSSPVFAPKVNGSAFSGFFASDAVSAFTTFILTIGVCGVAFWGFQYWRSHKSLPEQPKQVHVESPAKKAQSAVPAIPVTGQSANNTAANPPVAPISLSTAQNAAHENSSAASNVHVELKATAQCWTRVTADGKVLFAGTLEPGDTRTVDANSVITIRAGNAAALSLILNGKDVPALGPAGQIRSVTLTQAGAQVRTPSPELVSDF